MSYTAANLSLIAQNIGGGKRHFLLTGTDSLATVLGASYVSDGVDKGMRAGDYLTYVKTDTSDRFELAVASVGATAATLDGISTVLGASSTTPLAFYGVTPTTQPTSANQAAVATTAITAIATTAATSSGAFGFTSAQANGIIAGLNSLITSRDAILVLLNQLRSDLVTVGMIKGS